MTRNLAVISILLLEGIAGSSHDATIGEHIFQHLFGIEPTPPCKLCQQWEEETDFGPEHYRDLYGDRLTCLIYICIFISVACLPVIQWNYSQKYGHEPDQSSPTALPGVARRVKEDTLRKPRKKKRKRQKRKTINVVLPTEVPPSALPDFRLQDNDVGYLKNANDYTSVIPKCSPDTPVCVKTECTEHARCRSLSAGKADSDVIRSDVMKENRSKKVHFDEKDPDYLNGSEPFPVMNNIGPPRLSSTFVDSSDDDSIKDDYLFDIQNAPEIQNKDEPLLSRDFECETAVGLFPWQNTEESSLERAIRSFRNNYFVVSCREKVLTCFRVIHDWMNVGARSLVDSFNNVGDSLNASFMNETLDVSDAMKNISFYGDDSGSVHNVASILAMKVAIDKMQSYVRNKNNSAEYDDIDFDDVMETSYHADGEYSDTDIDVEYSEHL